MYEWVNEKAVRASEKLRIITCLLRYVMLVMLCYVALSPHLSFLTSDPKRASKSSRLYWNSSEDRVPPPSVSDLRKMPVVRRGEGEEERCGEKGFTKDTC